MRQNLRALLVSVCALVFSATLAWPCTALAADGLQPDPDAPSASALSELAAGTALTDDQAATQNDEEAQPEDNTTPTENPEEDPEKNPEEEEPTIDCYDPDSWNVWTKTEDGTYVATNVNGATGMEQTDAKGGLGIDVSVWQHDIDWAKVKQTGLVDFVIIRAGWGYNLTSQDDAEFLDNVKGCIENDIPFGIYLYSYAYDTSTALDEAEHVLRLLETAGLTPDQVAYPIYYDLETQDPKTGRPAGQDGEGNYHVLSNDQVEQVAATFCSAIREAGYTPGIYSNLNWWTNYLTGPGFDAWHKWVAQYNLTCSYQGEYDIWQCMCNGRIDGIPANVDINFDYVDLDAPAEVDDSVETMYRMYNQYTGEHFYTASTVERDTLIGLGWTYEGTGWIAPTEGIPVYRLFNPYSDDHHYTTSKEEYESLAKIGWQQEGEGWYSADPSAENAVALQRLFNPYAETATHHYTASPEEVEKLVEIGWVHEEVAWYGVDPN
ncbi:glycoside hydrolase family 25 protein [Thermophilibacter provencensis]|uniref:Glycoside hydrolase family 25 protein n=1 Tax=Thermophilibacter provencensis TaxID=1852386 RepID=A0ABT7V1I3_9ACTN|nr:glycoside hydrolase family 25 protein [Thermophilibacter provencensis]MDM8270468.1 glycoside hydrolase family 25 protein [Thermophilibacter provencensis]